MSDHRNDKRTKSGRLVFVSILLAAALAGCIRQSQSEIPSNCNTRFRFSFTHNPTGEDMFAEAVNDIHLYLFDQATGRLAKILTPDKGKLVSGSYEVRLPEGEYTIVCWAGGGDDLTRGGYRPVSMDDNGNYSGVDEQTTPDGFRLMFDCMPGVENTLVPATGSYDDLFFAMKRDVEVKNKGMVTVTLPLVRNTNLLRISADEEIFSALEFTPEMFVSGPHEGYGYDNTLTLDAATVRYALPLAVNADVSHRTADAKIQRIEIARSVTDPVLLHMRNPATGEDMFEPINLVEYLMAIEDADGNHPYRTQDDIDREYLFDIELRTGLIVINGYEIVDLEGDVDEWKPDWKE